MAKASSTKGTGRGGTGGSSKSSGAKKTAGSKTAAKKASAKKAAKKSSAPAKSATKKSTSKKPAAKKAPAKKAASGKTTAKKSASKKPATKKPAAKKPTTKKPAAKKPVAKKAANARASAGKPAVKKDVEAKSSASSKKVAGSKSQSSKAAPSKPVKGGSKAAPASAGADAAGKKAPNRKGITIVSKKPAKKSRAKQPTPKFPPTSGRLLGPGSPIRKPLIPSGPKATTPGEGDGLSETKGKRKSPFKKRELDRFRSILRIKRAQLIGDVSQMEAEALLGNAGDLGSLPQHLAEQGSDSYERSLSLDLAAHDRSMIKEIDDAIQRIDEGVFGVCEHNGKPIPKERLDELPWTRYSIEGARAQERSSLPG